MFILINQRNNYIFIAFQIIKKHGSKPHFEFSHAYLLVQKTDFVCIIFNTIFEIWHILPFRGYLICLCSPYSFGNIVIFIQVRIMK